MPAVGTGDFIGGVPIGSAAVGAAFGILHAGDPLSGVGPRDVAAETDTFFSNDFGNWHRVLLTSDILIL